MRWVFSALSDDLAALPQEVHLHTLTCGDIAVASLALGDEGASMPSMRIVDRLATRLIDISGAFLGLLLLSPLFLLCAFWVKLDSPGPVFYRATRVGQHGRLFRLYKFRSMIVGADRLGPGITVLADSRVTRSGRVLRKLKLDELPQLLNVLRGEMSLVGPRPEDPRYLDEYTPAQRRIFKFRPGLTSAASLAYRNEEDLLSGPNSDQIYRQQVLPAKLAVDLTYFNRRTVFTDLVLIFRTIPSVFGWQGCLASRRKNRQ